MSRFTAYACFVTALTLGVILWGAYVRASRSGDGCGAHWPLCNGEAIPSVPTGGSATKTAIEYAHRATSGLDGLLVLGLVIWAFRSFPRGRRARTGAVLSGVFIITESLIGAGLVLFGLVGENATVMRAVYLSVHLTNTFILLAVMALTAWWSQSQEVRAIPAGGFFRGQTGLALAAALALSVSGAIAALGATLFPEVAATGPSTAEALASPSAQLLFSLRQFKLHPLMAVMIGAYLSWFAFSSMRASEDPWTGRWGWMVIGLTLAQLAAGVLNMALLAPIWMQIVHLLLATLLWIALVLLAAVRLERNASA
jgi:heme A synthase